MTDPKMLQLIDDDNLQIDMVYTVSDSVSGKEYKAVTLTVYINYRSSLFLNFLNGLTFFFLHYDI